MLCNEGYSPTHWGEGRCETIYSKGDLGCLRALAHWCYVDSSPIESDRYARRLWSHGWAGELEFGHGLVTCLPFGGADGRVDAIRDGERCAFVQSARVNDDRSNEVGVLG